MDAGRSGGSAHSVEYQQLPRSSRRIFALAGKSRHVRPDGALATGTPEGRSVAKRLESRSRVRKRLDSRRGSQLMGRCEQGYQRQEPGQRQKQGQKALSAIFAHARQEATPVGLHFLLTLVMRILFSQILTGGVFTTRVKCVYYVEPALSQE